MDFFKPKRAGGEEKESEPMANLFASQEEEEPEEEGAGACKLEESLRRVDFTRVETTASEAHLTHRDDGGGEETKNEFSKVIEEGGAAVAEGGDARSEEKEAPEEKGAPEELKGPEKREPEDEEDEPVVRKRTRLFLEGEEGSSKFKRTHEDLWRELEQELNSPVERRTDAGAAEGERGGQGLFDDEEEPEEGVGGVPEGVEAQAEEEDLTVKRERAEGGAGAPKGGSPLRAYEFSEESTSETLTLGKEQSADEGSEDFNEREKYMSCFASNNSSGFRAFVDNYYRYKGTFSFPPWLELRNIKDAEGNRPTESTYNPSTLWIPPRGHRWAAEYKSGHYTECMRQWWEVKSSYFDSLVFFKMGRFYELFYHDACILQSLVNLRWMGSESKPHVGFPEKSLHFYASSCVQAGYRVVVVEQTETPLEMERRNREEGTSKKTVKRDVCEIITPGSVTRPEMLGRQARPLVFISVSTSADAATTAADSNDVGAGGANAAAGATASSADENADGSLDGEKALFKRESPVDPGDAQTDAGRHPRVRQKAGRIAVVSIDVSMSRVKFGSIEYAQDFAQLKTVLLHLFPAEVVIDKALVEDAELVRSVRALPYAPEITWHALNINEEELYAKVRSGHGELARPAKPALVLAQSYLRLILLERMVEYCYVEPMRLWEMEVMRLDFASAVHLELFRTQEGAAKNSLFDHLNRTSTSFGERLLRSWLLNPLTSVASIDRRSECVEYLVSNFQLVTTLARDLEGFPDLERMLGKVLNAASNYHKRAVYFDEAVFFKLHEFHALLDRFKQLEDVVRSFLSYTGAERPEGSCGLLEDMKAELAPTADDVLYFRGRIQSVGDKKCQSLDWARSQRVHQSIDAVLARLEKVLDGIRAHCPSANFVNCKFRFEVEVTESHYNSLVGGRGKKGGAGAHEFEVTSTKSGFVRLHTPEIRRLVEELEEEEFRLKESEEEFYQWLVGEFHKRSLKFCRLVEQAAVLDCLAALASVARNAPYSMVRARVLPRERNVLAIRNSVYPMGGVNLGSFVPNDVSIGDFDGNRPIAVITGPNMGGKSTLLRQIALTVIMGQIGSFVPASFCEFSVVDSLFTRLGASDNLVEGKSTFLVELEDIASILTKGTASSLAIIDELGRGTSTFDGAAIAVATLEKIAKIGCRCVFTTHFQDVCAYAREFPGVAMFHMGVNVDEETKNVEFLYKLRPGVCPDSHGMHVAQLARIPDHVLRNARRASEKLKARAFSSHTPSGASVPAASAGTASTGGGSSSAGGVAAGNGAVMVKNEGTVKEAEEERESELGDEELERVGIEILEAHRAGNLEILCDIYHKFKPKERN